MSKPARLTQQVLTQIYYDIYPADGSMPVNPRALHLRQNEEARHQLLFSLLIQMAAQQEKDAVTLAVNIKQLQDGAAQGGQEEAGAEEVADGEAGPAVQAVSGRPMPTPRPAPSPMSAAVVQPGTEVTMTPFTPANMPAPPQQSS